MGLASKLAAANAGGAPGGASAGGQSSYGVQPSHGQPQQQPQSGYGTGLPPQQGYGAQSQSAAHPSSMQPGAVGYQQGPLAGQAPPAYGQGQPPQQAYGAPAQSGYGAPQSQSSYPAPSGAPPPAGARPTSGQYGAPPGQPLQQAYGQQGYNSQGGQQPGQQQGYGAPPPAPGGRPAPGPGGSVSAQQLQQVLENCAREQKLQAFYPPGSPVLSQIAQNVAQSGALNKLASQWRLPMEIAVDLCKIALFDTILFIDDSGSMAFEEGGERIDDLKLIIGRVAFAASLFDQDGIQVRFMNSQIQGNNIRSEGEAVQLISQVKFSGLTPFGTELDKKVIFPLVLQPARQGQLQKPALVIAVTDGQPAGEDRHTIFNVILRATDELSRTRFGADALSLSIAQVGNDVKAREFLAELDSDRRVGSMIDCTSNYELEADEMQKKGVDLTPELWLVKMLLGSIDDSYDEKDE